MNCKTCKKETKNPKFCSKSCAAIFNNKGSNKKRQLAYNNCKICDTFLDRKDHTDRRTLCDKCNPKLSSNYKNISLETYQNKVSVKEKHTSWKNAHIRLFNRTWNKALTKLPCAKCGYDKHVELCHIKPISEFDNTSTLGEINDITNVIQLCPNCHWEFDNLK